MRLRVIYLDEAPADADRFASAHRRCRQLRMDDDARCGDTWVQVILSLCTDHGEGVALLGMDAPREARRVTG